MIKTPFATNLRVVCGRGRDPTLSGPVVLAGQRDVLPTQGRDMGKQVRWWSFTSLGQPGDDLSELPGVPVDDDGGKEVQPRRSGRAVPRTSDRGSHRGG